MPILLAIAAIAVQQPPKPVAQPRAVVRIERPVQVDSGRWLEAPRSKRSERAVRDESGRVILLRLVEMP